MAQPQIDAFEPVAVIYARVSSSAQTKRGDGLGSQETRCREFARMKGYHVAEVFRDDVTGKLTARPGMEAMLGYLRQHRSATPVVIIDDITRLARDIMAHWELRATIERAGGRLESPSIEFGQDSDSVLVENLLASVSQHQRQKNAEQTLNRMQARMLNGYWCFQAPVGYRYARQSGHGKVLVPDEPLASIIQQALEGFAHGQFSSQSEVRQFLERQPDFPKERGSGRVHPQRVTELLTRPLYAGMVEAPNWKISLRHGQHQGLIGWETFERVQKRLQQKAYAPARQDLHVDFPLRGAVHCADCGQALTACWSKGKKRRYPYYLCYNRHCPSRRKSIPRDQIEGAFAELLQRLRPCPQVYELMRRVLSHAWENRQGEHAQRRKKLATTTRPARTRASQVARTADGDQ